MAVTSGVSANLIGVMVAVALLPPMVAFGLLLGGGQSALVETAGLLVAVNIACLNLAGVGTFLIRGVRPGRFYDTDHAKKAVGVAILIWVLAVAAAVVVIWLAGEKSSEAQDSPHSSPQQKASQLADDVSGNQADEADQTTSPDEKSDSTENDQTRNP